MIRSPNSSWHEAPLAQCQLYSFVKVTCARLKAEDAWRLLVLILRPTCRKSAKDTDRRWKIHHVVSKLDYTGIVGAFAELHRHVRWTSYCTLRTLPTAVRHGALNFTCWFLRAGRTIARCHPAYRPRVKRISSLQYKDTLSDVLLSTRVT
jgi:hypothetical protein